MTERVLLLPGTGYPDRRYTHYAPLQDANFKLKASFIVMLVLLCFACLELQGETVSSPQNEPGTVDSTQTISQYTVGDTLGSLNDLNVVALNQSAVFVYIPTAQPEEISSQTRTALLAAQESLLNLEIVVGLYTLSVNSEDYSLIVKQAIPPACIVASKGGGMVPVTGEITRDSLIQAFLTADSSTTCGCGQ